MCGIAAFLPKGKYAPDRRLLLSMGMANEERGTDNCGIAVGKEIKVGGGVQSKFREFYIANKKEIDELLNTPSKPVIIHTRRSATWNVGSDYAHPFWFGFKEPTPEIENYIVGCHNGIVTNKEELYTKFCGKTPKTLVTIDSQYLLCSLLCSDNKEEVLKTYDGDAALIFYTDKFFYAWKGGSNNVEERPLYYLDTEHGWYFSSTRESLEFSSDYDATPIRLKNNELMKFSLSGKFIESKIIHREEEITTIGYGKTLIPTTGLDPSIPAQQDLLKRYVDTRYKPLEGIYYIYSSSYFHMFFEKPFYNREPVYFIDGIPTLTDKRSLIMLNYQINHKKFNIVSFMKKYKDIIKKVILKEFPIIIKDELRFVISLEKNGELTCEDMLLKKKEFKKQEKYDNNPYY